MSVTNTETYSARATRVISRCRQLAACTEVPGEINRPFLAPSMRQVHGLVRNWMEAAGMTVHIDAIGNIRGLYPSAKADAPQLILASHLDTVPNAGPFDGILGVVLAITLIEQLRGQPLPYAIEVIGFSEEEGVRYAKPFLGSLAVIGKITREILALTDSEGVTIEQALLDFNLDPTQLPAAILPQNTFAYLELHIEQGPVLESEDLPLGIVDRIAGQTRAQLIFNGQANHAGTTPMHLRHDAMAAAAEWITAIEDYASSHQPLVATVGKVETLPGATNVISGKVIASLDVRHGDDVTRKTAADAILQLAMAAAEKRGVQLTVNLQLDHPAVPLNPHLTALLAEAATHAGHATHTMTSGAGHDAMILAPVIPSAMLFLRSPAGLSHHPDENVLPQDVEAAIATAMEFLTRLGDDKTKEAHA
jgi:allantoate deiminase